MALKKRGDIWHTHFFVDGERFRNRWQQAIGGKRSAKSGN